MIIIGTTISLIFTVVATKLLEHFQRAKDRRLSAMMVMSNIEKFARNMEEHERYLSSLDSTASWLLNTPVEDLELLPEDELNSLIQQTTSFIFISYDKSAESIFSNNIETWKNMGNVLFIDRVGECFSSMHQVEEYWNKWMSDASDIILDVKRHPENYEGSTLPIKTINSEKGATHDERYPFLQGLVYKCGGHHPLPKPSQHGCHRHQRTGGDGLHRHPRARR
ncbi:MAG: hypothetical protein SPM02_09630 [Bacteroidales bacterium]|nr:hypothetical protein [Bacteroidales bacterium]